MLRKCLLATMLAAAFTAMGVAASAQTLLKPLANEDVLNMVKGGLGEPTIVDVIQSQESHFDIAPAALLHLKKNGVSATIIDVMVDAAKHQRQTAPCATVAAAPAPSAAAPPAPIDTRALGQPAVLLVQGDARQPLPPGRTQIAQTKAKPSTLNALASDGTLTQALGGANQGMANMGMMKPGSTMANGAMMAMPMLAPAMLASNLLSHRNAPVTDVWAVAGQKSETVVHVAQPVFEVHYETIPGINSDEYEPVLLRLEPTPSNFRLVGATQARPDELQTSAADWGIYSGFVEERIPAQATRVSPGNYKVQPSSQLAAGEYGVALRPINRNKMFVGSSIAQNTGDGLMFDAVWSFEVQ